MTSASSSQSVNSTDSTTTLIEDFPSLDDLASSIADSPDFIMSTTGVDSPSPASSMGDAKSNGVGGTETPPLGYMSEDGDTQEPAGHIMS